jgi:hypothetical protein
MRLCRVAPQPENRSAKHGNNCDIATAPQAFFNTKELNVISVDDSVGFCSE